MKFKSAFAKTAAVAAIALAAAGTASVAQARSDVYFSVGAVAPGMAVGVSNYVAPAYYPPVTYVQPAPVYVEPAPVYYTPPVVYPGVTYAAPVYYGGHRHWHHDRGHHRGWR